MSEDSHKIYYNNCIIKQSDKCVNPTTVLSQTQKEIIPSSQNKGIRKQINQVLDFLWFYLHFSPVTNTRIFYKVHPKQFTIIMFSESIGNSRHHQMCIYLRKYAETMDQLITQLHSIDLPILLLPFLVQPQNMQQYCFVHFIKLRRSYSNLQLVVMIHYISKAPTILDYSLSQIHYQIIIYPPGVELLRLSQEQRPNYG